MSHRRWFLAAGLLALLPGRAVTQNSVYIEYKGKGHLVRAARDDRPCIELGGKLQRVPADRIGLREAKDYLPALVSIAKVKVASSQIDLTVAVQSLNPELRFSAEFESAYPLGNAFMLLDFQGEGNGNGYYLHEIGRLEPYEPLAIDLVAPLKAPFGRGRYQIHVFSNGAEVLNSTMPSGVRERVLDRMVARRVEKSPDSGPQPFFGPPPRYPEKLRKSRIEGKALISVRITPTGAVADPQVVSATNPEFGEAALAAAQLWRFVPAIRGGQAVEAKTEMPFAFKAPSEGGKKGG